MTRRTFLTATVVRVATAQEVVRALIITGEVHYHDCRATTAELRRILEPSHCTVRVTEDFRGATGATLEPYDVLIVNYSPREPEKVRWGRETETAFFDAVRSGKGIVVYHYGIGFRPELNGEYELLCAGTWRPGNGQHSPRHDYTITVKDGSHPITGGMPVSFVHRNDELYANLKWVSAADFHVLATAYDDHSLYQGKAKQPTPGAGLDHPVLWTCRYGKGRVFVTALGHDVDAMQDPFFRTTLLRGVKWAARAS